MFAVEAVQYIENTTLRKDHGIVLNVYSKHNHNAIKNTYVLKDQHNNIQHERIQETWLKAEQTKK